MCGRYTLRRLDLVRAAFDALILPGFEEFTDRPRFNIAPSQPAPIVRINSQGKRVMNLAQWGLIPSWVTGKPKLRPCNARADKLSSSGMYRQAFARRRCLIPADGFYEPRGPKSAKNRPWYYFQMRDGLPFAIGGLWERWKPDPDSQPLDTFTIITTEPSAVMRPIHDRQPLVIAPKDYSRWLDPQTPAADVKDLLAPHLPQPIEFWPVSDAAKSPVNKDHSLNDDPSMIKPLG